MSGAPAPDDGEPGRLAELREELAAWLGPGHAITAEAAVAAVAHPGYRRRLAFARGAPEALDWVLAHPPALPPSAAAMVTAIPETTSDQSARALVRRATASMISFAANGFAQADDQLRERRWAACQSCPHLRDPPREGLHRITRRIQPEAKVCGLCGCVASAKVRAAHETCPGRHPSRPGLTRWGEPVRAPAREPRVPAI